MRCWRGNGYLEIERNGRGRGLRLSAPSGPHWSGPPERRSLVPHGDRRAADRPRCQRVIHIMDQSQDGYVGISQIAMAREAVAMGLATEAFGASSSPTMQNRAASCCIRTSRPAGAQEPDRPGRRACQQPGKSTSRLQEQGGLDNAHRVKVLEEGMKFVSTTIPPEDAQFSGRVNFRSPSSPASSTCR